MNEQQWNLFIMKYGGIDERSNNYRRKVMAYLKYKKQQPIGNCTNILEQWTEQDFDEYVKDNYNVKGDVTYKKVMTMKDKTDIKESEHDIQVKVCKYLKAKGFKYWAVPNGFVHNGADKMATVRYIAYMKSEGVRNGVYDLTILTGNGQIAFLELKTPKGRPSEEQLKWKEYFDNNGYKSAICKGYDEAVAFIDTL